MAKDSSNDLDHSADFVSGASVWQKWDAARHLMAPKQMQSAATQPKFREAFRDLGNVSIHDTGIDQLLAIALIPDWWCWLIRDLAVALVAVVREKRNTVTVDERTGPALAALTQALVHISPRVPRPTKLADAAAAIIELLDEFLATDFTLIADAETYSPLSVVSRWWQLSAYPQL